MRIPLDYYRILGLPIQATAEQLQQAHRDRTLQLPRREYSELASNARKQLLDEAGAVLSDPEARQAYDAKFLSKTYEVESESDGGGVTADLALDPNTPLIDIEPTQFAGALLLLQELGEYELVLKLALPMLGGKNISLKNGTFGDPKLVVPDIVLTAALACLELGREQWQQSNYENAATSLESGQEMLLREGLFPQLRGEIQGELYKLRPYRILELLAMPMSKSAQRRRGLQLLQDMLQERSGIDGNGDDQSGLDVDDFLRFIQQIRSHLTVAEQQELFVTEARRPSAVATYLAVYALVARGFAEREPSLIRRAKLMLTQLGRRQDVHLEQSVCSLLLGQTEEASAALALTQEYELIEFIREQSQDSPDLLPGLCLYAERWLQSEVFPYFRDLASVQVSLKDYFADDRVQAYLESLPETTVEEASEWMVTYSPPEPASVGLPPPSNPRSPAVAITFPPANGYSPLSGDESHLRGTAPAPTSPPVETRATRVRLAADTEPPRSNARLSPARGDDGTESQLLSPERSRIDSRTGGAESISSGNPPHSKLPVADRVRGTRDNPYGRERPSGEATPRLNRERGSGGSLRSSGTTGNRLKLDRLILLVVAGLFGLLFLWFLMRATWGLVAGMFAGPPLEGEQLSIRLDTPPIPIPDPAVGGWGGGPITAEIAKQVLEEWFAIKTKALGSKHEVELLSNILLDPALTSWRRLATSAKQENWYWEYQHKINAANPVINEADPDRATVEADVNEIGQYYEGTQVARTKDEKLRIKYELVRVDGQWRIRDWQVME
ncbi:MAG: hypothetical protein Fur0025_07580 [Oscillatoriaceae cyanobacterium]